MAFNGTTAEDFPDFWQGNGVVVYINTGRTEPVFMAGIDRPVSQDDIEAAINFLRVVGELLSKGEA